MVYTEEQYFDEFYPESWGDWRKECNIGMYREHPDATGVTWMDYHLTGYLCSSKEDGLMKVFPINRDGSVERFFIKCGDVKEESKVDRFIQPAFQSKTGEYFAGVSLEKCESNLDLYNMYISGADDSSFSKDYIGLESAMKDIDYIKENGITDITSMDFYFTN